MVDCATRYPEALPLRSAPAEAVAREATETGGKNWDLALLHVLFAVCKVPQASAGISPFELLYGRRPRGLLDLA